MQIEKALKNIAYVFRTYPEKNFIQTIYNFVVIYPWNFLFHLKVAYFLTVSIAFSICKQIFTAQ